MRKLQIMLNSTEDVQEFVNTASRCPFEIDLESGSVYIDAKSFLGVLTMGINRKLEVHCGNNEAAFLNSFKKFAIAG